MLDHGLKEQQIGPSAWLQAVGSGVWAYETVLDGAPIDSKRRHCALVSTLHQGAIAFQSA